MYYTPSEGEINGDMNETEFYTFLHDVEKSNNNVDSYIMNMDVQATAGDEDVNLNSTATINTDIKEGHFNYDMRGMPQRGPMAQSHIGIYIDDDVLYRNDSLRSNWNKEYINETEGFDNIDDIWNISNHGASSDMYKYGDVYISIESDYIEVRVELDSIEMNYITDDLRKISMMDSSSFGDTIIWEKYDRDTNKLKNYTMESTTSVKTEDVSVILDGEYDYNNVNHEIIPEEIREVDN